MKKIVDMISDFTYKKIDIDYFTEDEIDDLVADMNLTKIEQLALNNINRDSKGLVPFRKKKSIKKLLLCAAIVTSLISSTILAKQYLSKFTSFWGTDLVIPESVLVRIGNTYEMGDVSVEFEEAVVSGNSVALMLSFKKIDGSKFDETASVSYVMDRWEHTLNGSTEYRLSDDQTELLCLYRVNGSQPIAGEKLQIEIDTLYETERILEELDISLDQIYHAYPIQLTEENGSGNSDILCQSIEPLAHKQMRKYEVEMPLEENIPTIKFESVGFVGEQLILTIHSYLTEEERIDQYAKNVRTEATILGLRDIRDNQIYEAERGYGYLKGDLGETIYYSKFDGLGIEDLPYLKPIIEYDIIHYLADGIWKYDWIVEGGEKAFQKTLGEDYQLGDVMLTELSISATGVVLMGKTSYISKQVFEQPTIRLLIKEDEWITLGCLSAGNDGGDIVWQYELAETPVIDLSQLKKIAIDNWVIPLLGEDNRND
ncbi:MAG: hypothetical protein ACRC1P_01735 [Cellulosilyticaceae bacterium]